MISFIKNYLRKREQQRFDAECFHRLRSDMSFLQRWCGESRDLDAGMTWLLERTAGYRGELTGSTTMPVEISAFRERLRAGK